MVTIKLPHSTKIRYTMLSSGDNGSLISTNGKLLLSLGRSYKIPVDTEESLDDHNLFKVIGKISDMLDVRNIDNGFATIIPLVHDTVIIKDNMELGTFI